MVSALAARRRARVLLAAALTLLATGAVAAAPPASAAGVVHVVRARPVVLAPGIVQYHESFRTLEGYPESAWITTVNLAIPGTRLNIVVSHNHVRTNGETVLEMARRTGAKAGVNGDLFDFGGTNAPCGGEVVNGQILKSPIARRVGQLAILADGRAVLGPVAYTGNLSRADAPLVQHFMTVNDLGAAQGGGITLLTPSLGAAWLPWGCVLASGTRRLGAYTIAALNKRPQSIGQLSGAGIALFGCGAGGRWLLAHAGPGTRLQSTMSVTSPEFPTARVRSVIAGARMVIRSAVPYFDRSTAWHTSGHNPETFVCVSRNHRFVTLGTVDGRAYQSVGVTFPQVTSYMLFHGCWDGLVMDGGGSTTTVGTRGPGSALRMKNVVAWGEPARPVANGIFAYHH